MHARALERVFEHPEKLLEVATRTALSTLAQVVLFQPSQVFTLQLESLFKAVVVLLACAAAQVVEADAGVCNFDWLGPGLTPVLGRF